MKTQTATTTSELYGRTCATIAANTLTNVELIEQICNLRDGLRRVNSKASLALADVVDTALANAQQNPINEPFELSKLAVWTGMIQMGWI